MKKITAALAPTRQASPGLTAAAAAPSRVRVCLVTEELAGIAGSGGIGAAFLELAQLLAREGTEVDVLYCPIGEAVPAIERPALAARFAGQRIKLTFLDTTPWVTGALGYEKKAYAVARRLQQQEQDDREAGVPPYAFVHFHDYKGLGCFATGLKRQGLAFADSRLVVQLHGPTRWTIDANHSFFTHEDQLKIDHMERLSIAQADVVVSPSAYLVDWLRGQGFTLPADTRVIKNVCSGLHQALCSDRRDQAGTPGPVTDLVFFARHEDRKGFGVFCEAVQALNDDLAAANVTVTFLGKMGLVDNQPSGIYLIDKSAGWRFRMRVRSGLARSDAAQYLQSLKRPLVVIPSPAENSPYTVLESIMLGLPVISSLDGGGPELFADPHYPGLCRITPAALADTIRERLAQGLAPAAPSETAAQIDAHWLGFHAAAAPARAVPVAATPRVTLAITHHERPRKLVDAILSAVRQTYANTEILVVDDGSSTPATLAALQDVERLLQRVGGRLVRRENGYLGAARNTALREAGGEYVVFLDDDDLAFPDLVQTLVTAALHTGADAATCLNVFMDEQVRGEALAGSARAPVQVSYVPLAGPLALAPMENCIGAATAIFRKRTLLDIGGYSELKGVGHEDYELYIRLLQAGRNVQLVPLPLYFYEVGRPSMLSRTSLSRNFRRCFDAVDMERDPAAWRDLLSLNVGKNVALNGHNRQWWLYSLRKTAALRHRVLGEQMDRATQLAVLMELATAEGAARMHNAFAQDLQQSAIAALQDGAEQLVDLEADTVDAATPAARARAADPRLTDLRVDLALGRPESALRPLARHLSDFRAVDADALQLASQLVHDAKARALPAALWKELATALRGCRVARSDRATLAASALQACVLADDAEGLAAILAPELAQAEQHYVQLHADVRQAIDGGALSSGLEHFLGCGLDEQRAGFDVLVRLMDFARADGRHRGTVQDTLGLLQRRSDAAGAAAQAATVSVLRSARNALAA